jgi:hypothetical protein
MCTCMFNYLLGQLGMGTTITMYKEQNEMKRFVSRHFKDFTVLFRLLN